MPGPGTPQQDPPPIDVAKATASKVKEAVANPLGALKGITDSVASQAKKALNVVTPSKEGMKTRAEGLKKMATAPIIAPIAPIGASRRGMESGLQVLTGKDRNIPDNVTVVKDTYKGTLQAANGVGKIVVPFRSTKKGIEETKAGATKIISAGTGRPGIR